MAQGRSTHIILMIKWIRTSRFSIENSRSAHQTAQNRTCVFKVPTILHFEPSRDALSVRSDIISSIDPPRVVAWGLGFGVWGGRLQSLGGRGYRLGSGLRVEG